MEIITTFERWLNGSPLSDGEMNIITLSIIMCVLVFINMALLIYASIIRVIIKAKEKKQKNIETGMSP